jgi:hypothetical protein
MNLERITIPPNRDALQAARAFAYVRILGVVLGSDCGADIADGEVRPPHLEYRSGKKAFLDQCPTSKCQSLSSDERPPTSLGVTAVTPKENS